MPYRESRWAAALWAMVATSGSPSGTAATATATPEASASRTGTPRSSPRAVTAAPPMPTAGRAIRPRWARWPSIPVGRGASAASSAARPASVCEPVATTTAYAEPVSTVQPS